MTIFRAASADGDHWGLAAKACLQRMAPLPIGANLGFVYVTEGFADDLSSIIVFLRETTSIDRWLGGVGFGVFGPDREIHGRTAMAVMVGSVDADAVRSFASFDPTDHSAFLAEHGPWLADQKTITALVHADPRDPQLATTVADLSATGRAFLVGGLLAPGGGPRQVCGKVGDAPLSGVLMGDGISLATGLTQGCSPIGGRHRITEAVNNVVMQLDGVSALQTLKAEAGDIIARDLKRAAGYIHVAQPVAGSDQSDYIVHGLLAIDPTHGWLAVDGDLTVGDQLIFVRRDPNEAQKDLQRMLDGLARRLADRKILGGLYISCIARDQMFGKGGRESEMIREALGDFPMVGFSASGEICYDRLYSFTGVLALFL